MAGNIWDKLAFEQEKFQVFLNVGTPKEYKVASLLLTTKPSSH